MIEQAIVNGLKDALTKLIEVGTQIVQNPPIASNHEEYRWIFDCAEDILNRLRPHLPPQEYDQLDNRIRPLKEAFKAIVEDTWQPDF